MSNKNEVEADLYSVLTTLIVFAVISVSIYYMLLKPILNPPPAATNTTSNTTHGYVSRGVGGGGAAAVAASRRTPQAAAAAVIENDVNVDFLKKRTPPHVTNNSKVSSSILVDGLVPYRHLDNAAQQQQQQQSSSDAQLRKERARVMSRLLTNRSPPSRGSTIVVAVPLENVSNEKVQRVIYLLATMYSVFVNVHCKESDAFKDSNLGFLPETLLPKHRIVASRSVTGRVAFVRQLGRVEIVVDFDEQVRTQLSRFGFNVFVYDMKGDGLGKLLSV